MMVSKFVSLINNFKLNENHHDVGKILIVGL